MFASELKTGPVCQQPLCVLVVTSVDKLLSQLVRLVHRFTCITADLAHTRLTIRLAAVELDPDVRARLLLDTRTVNLMLLQLLLLLLRPLLLHEKEMLLRRLSIIAPFAAIILRIVLGETTAHGLTLLTGRPILNRLLLHKGTDVDDLSVHAL